jgi:hypothetical protein
MSSTETTEHIESPSQIVDILQGVQVVADFLASNEVLDKVVRFVAKRATIAFPDPSIAGTIPDFLWALRFPTARPVLVTSVSIGASCTVRIGHQTFIASFPMTIHPLVLMRSGDIIEVADTSSIPIGSVMASGLEL